MPQRRAYNRFIYSRDEGEIMPIYNAPLTAIDTMETKRYAGLKNARFDDAKIASAADEAALLAAPRGIWQQYAYDSSRSCVLSDPPFPIIGRSIQKHLDRCEAVIILAATVGEGIEKHVTESFDAGNYAYAVLLDAAATAAVEQVADAMERTIRPAVDRAGYTMRWRYSPGYGDWPLKEQPHLIRFSHAAEIGIHLTESLMLWPRKSITAIIGLAKKIPCIQALPPSGCASCDKLDCPSRRLPSDEPSA